MSQWTEQKMETLQQQAIQQLVACELQVIAAKAVLSEIEMMIAWDHFINNCKVVIGHGTCIFDFYSSGPLNVVIERLHPIDPDNDHIKIEFRAFTKRGKPCKQTDTFPFECLKCFKKSP